MRKTFLSLMVSLDGYCIGPGPEDRQLDWHKADAEWEAYATQMLRGSDALLLGRKTYENFLAYWPHQSGPLADRLGEMSKTVYSRTLKTPGWRNVRIAGDAIADIRSLKRLPGGDMVILGSPTLARALLEADLLDFASLAINPVSLGAGKRFFPEDGVRRPFVQIETRTFESGIVLATYERAL